MRLLWRATRLLWAADAWAMWRGAAAAVAVLAMGAALLGLSGWFITATGMAGLAGIGIAFDVFRPSAGVRFLALGRAGARYAERVLTHDATLRALARLRVTLLRRLSGWPIPDLRRLRGAAELTRITGDVDALDGLLLRLILPMLAAVVTHLGAFAVLYWLVGAMAAWTILVGYGLGAALVLLGIARGGITPARAAQRHLQQMRRQVVGLFRGQRAFLVGGGLGGQLAALSHSETALRGAEARLDRIDRRAAFGLSAVSVLVVAALLLAGSVTVQAGGDPALGALGVFVALALAETVMPLRRGLAELGRMHDAAARVLGDAAPAAAAALPKVTPDASAGLRITDLRLTRPDRLVPLIDGLSLHIRPGDTVALRGRSGVGKSTLLDAVAGLAPLAGGRITVLGADVATWPEDQLRAHLTLVPQRAALIGGTIRDNLALARDRLDDDSAWSALRAVSLDHVAGPRGGLDMALGEGGAGLSGGEARRLVLARAILRAPDILLLDEPTEGLDDARARAVLAQIRAVLPRAVILMAAHRPAELDAADRIVDL